MLSPKCSMAVMGLTLALVVPSRSADAPDAAELLARADRLGDQGNWFAAAPVYAEAAKAFSRVGDRRGEIAARFGQLRRAMEAGQYRKAREEAVALLADPVVEQHPDLKLRGLFVLGSIDLNLNTAAALEDWTKARDLAASIGDRRRENRAKGQLGLVAGVSGNLGEAAVAVRSAMQVARELNDTPSFIYFSVWLANGLAVNGMAEMALPILDNATKAARVGGFESVPLQLTIARIRALLRLPESRRGPALSEATRLVQEALPQAEREGIAGAQTELYNAAGHIATIRGDFSAAREAFERTMAVAKAATLPRMEAGAYLNLSQTYRKTGNPSRALELIETGIATARQVDEGYELPIYVAEKAEALAANGRLREADATFRQATDLVDGLLLNAPSSQVKSAMISAASDIYLNHFKLASGKLGDTSYAFAVIEKARGRALFDSIRYAMRSGASLAASAREREIARLQRSLVHDSLTPAQTSRTLAALDRAYESLIPAEYRRKRAEMSLVPREPAALDAVRARLPEGEVLVEYVLSEPKSFAIRVTSRSARIIDTLPSRSTINRLSQDFTRSVRSGADARSAGEKLHAAVIAPVLDESTQSLIVVPDGALHLVPFAAVPDLSGQYLVKRLAVTAAPSATVYHLLSTQRRSATSLPLLAVAYSPDQGTASNFRGLASLRSGSLARLPYAKEEALVAAQTLGVESVALTGLDASEAKLKLQPLSRFRFLHLAAHGIAEEAEPDRAALVLSPGDGGDDGLWQAREIVRHRLNAEAVVLSACETGTGKLQGQEGVMNLARAFLIAGARSVVASLWAVEDRSTATLMQSFYKHLAAGANVRDSLRQAQLDFVRDFGDNAKPQLWAGFEVIGYGTRAKPRSVASTAR